MTHASKRKAVNIGLFRNGCLNVPKRLSQPQTRLARENRSVWKTRSLPSVRPLTIGEVKAGFPIYIMESIVHGESAGRLI